MTMANCNDRQTTLSRLSKLRQEIQQLTDSLTQPMLRPTSSRHSDEARSQSTSRYTSELEAKYVGKGYDGTISTATQPSNSGRSWTSDKLSGNSGQLTDVASTSSTHSTRSVRGYKDQAADPSMLYQGREISQYPAIKSSSHSQNLVHYSDKKPSTCRYASFGNIDESFQFKRTIFQDTGGYVSNTSRLKEIEEKYLHHSVSATLTKHRSDPLSNCSDTRRSSSAHSLSSLEPLSRSWTSPKLKGSSHRVSHHIEPASPIAGYRSTDKPSKYSWRQSPTSRKSDDIHRPLFTSETSRRARNLSTRQDSSALGHQPTEPNQSKYRFDLRSTTASSHSTHKRNEDHHKPSTSHPVRHTCASASTRVKASDTQSTSHSRSKSKPVTTTTRNQTTRNQVSVPNRSHGFSSRSSSDNISSRGRGITSKQSRGFVSTQGRGFVNTRGRGFVSTRGRGFVSTRGRGFVSTRGRGFASLRSHEASRGRGQRFMPSRGYAFSTRRGRGFMTFRGRGTRGYRSSRARGRGSMRSRGGGFFRGRGSPGPGTNTVRSWRVSHRTEYRGKVTSSSPKNILAQSTCSFSSRYALRKSLGKSTQKKPLSFMEKRRQTVLSNTPVLLRSKFNLIKGHRSVIKPALSLMSLSAPARKTTSVKRLVTVKNTRTKLIRRAEGDRRPSGSLVNLQGTQFKLRINRFSKALYRIPSSTHTATPGATISIPSSSKKNAETASRVGHKLVLKSTIPSVTRKVASHVLQRSIYTSLAAKQRIKKQSITKQYCMFYNLYGRCKRGDACPYIHDPEKVAVCTRFLRGTCPKTDGSCLFSHKVSKEKMSVCSYFLRGVCNRDDCPYSHVKVSSKATICPDFVKGYCPLREKCKKKHVLRCAEFSKTGKCENGKKCPLLHKKDATKTTKSKVKMKKAVKRPVHLEEKDIRNPVKKRKTEENVNTPSFIKLSLHSPAENTAPSLSERVEGGNDVPSHETALTEALPLTASGVGEGSGIIPSFIKLSSVDRIKETARTSGIIKHRIVPNSEADPENSDMKTPANIALIVTAPSIIEGNDHLDSKSTLLNPSPDDPHPNIVPSGENTDTPTSIEPVNDTKEVTAPSLSSDGEGSFTSMPSFIELYADGSLDDSMEEYASTTQQEPKKKLQIRPQFLR